MKLLYCWRCRAEVPMMDETEFDEVYSAYTSAIRKMKTYRASSHATIAQAAAKFHPPVRALYRGLAAKAGMQGPPVQLDHLMKHRLAAYGPPCTKCGLPLRTPEAKLCAACGAKRAA